MAPARNAGHASSAERPRRTSPRTRSVAVAAGILAVVGSPFAVAATGDTLREGVRNGTTVKETEIIGKQSASPGKGGFVTRQSNTSTGPKAGGAAIYGCRAAAGGTLGGSAPCLRASNLADGYAFEFATDGPLAGLITIGDPSVPNPGRPFATNATGVATGLNADKVDGKDASELVGATGPAGPPGPAGAKGDTGTAGAKGETGPSDAFAGFGNGSVPLNADDTTLGTLDLEPGSYVIQSKMILNNSGTASNRVSDCRLTAGGDFDYTTQITFGGGNGGDSRRTIGLMVVHRFETAGTARLYCDLPTQGAGTAIAFARKMIATRVGSVTNGPFPAP